MGSNASDVKICNLALAALGADQISALNESTENARKLNAIYELTRDNLMTEHPWNFTIKRADLATLDETPAFGYTYVFQLPTDCLRVIHLEDAEDQTDFSVEASGLMSNDDTAAIKYIARITDPQKFSSGFVFALAARLAAELCYAITSSSTLAKLKWEEYDKVKLPKAKMMDAQEGKPQKVDESSWIDSRK